MENVNYYPGNLINESEIDQIVMKKIQPNW